MDVSDPADSSLGRGSGREDLYEYGGSETPSEAVVNAVAALSERPVTPFESDGRERALPPLYEAIDPDALDSLFDGGEDGSADRAVTFRYSEYRVTVESDAVSLAPVPE